jgi:histone H3/H4
MAKSSSSASPSKTSKSAKDSSKKIQDAKSASKQSRTHHKQGAPISTKSSSSLKKTAKLTHAKSVSKTDDEIPPSVHAPYGMGRSALERLGWRAGASSVSTKAKAVLLKLLTEYMDQLVWKTMIIARADGLRTIQSGHVALAADAHGVPLQC